jgi:hypothetical protein
MRAQSAIALATSADNTSGSASVFVIFNEP